MTIDELSYVERQLRIINRENKSGHEFLRDIYVEETQEYLKKRGYEIALSPNKKHYEVSKLPPENIL